MNKLITFSIILLIYCTTAIAGILKVPEDYSTIQEAINAAINGDTVLVSEGTYFENINFKGKGITVGSEFVTDGDVTHIAETIINGSLPAHSDTASCVLFINSEDSSAVLEGFTITGGRGTKWLDEHGAGTYYEGGGILTAFSSPTIKHNIIRENEAIKKARFTESAGGGGIRCGDGNPKIIGNIIIANKGMYGGGIVMNYSEGTIKNNLIYNNTVGEYASAPTYGGGGIWLNQCSSILIENNTIVENSSSGSGGVAGQGGGILVWGSNAAIRNNICWGNSQDNGTQISKVSGTVEASYNDVEDGFEGDNNISENPSFASMNFYLAGDSPCIDAGSPDEIFYDPFDGSAAIFPSMGTERNDMGAYGGPMRFPFPDNIVSVDEKKSEVINEFELLQNYPNPFNPTTVISFQVPAAGKVELKVYDMLGSEVAAIINERKSAGNYNVEFNARGLSSGVYFYQLKTDNFIDIKKMILIR
ncbi:MAG: T9SS type A sorting domain-containing protein [Melioribacteraceae bacterium]|nr:T9SS type A sorting domain-containing protein [Melioribacteraceae bacterium]MCF8354192.1 T9SS type A sorting domain-containing protein [Melioribacteraceae bacterium]MCF8392838.1 T9SS type A sorting domain-containing protein [Melioribacteraceae bacterium]MCF8418676.1 T9SS type A sorting domain-containing protein [Melioribacteraceae bacterium]